MEDPDEIERRRRLVAARQTDYSRWRNPGSYDPAWDWRAAAAYEVGGLQQRWICDLGCGSRQVLGR